MVVRHSPLACALVLSLTACKAAESDPNAPTGFKHVKTVEDDYAEARVARDGNGELFFGVVKHETPPPGFAPDPTPATDDSPRGRTAVKGKVPPGASKVLTVDVVGSREVIGRIEHVDDSAPTFVEAVFDENDDPARLWVAIVGPKGERLTQLYVQRYDARRKRELVKVGTPIQRVRRFGYGDADEQNTPGRFVFVLPAAEPGFLHPLDGQGERMALPPGVVGVKPVTSDDTSKEWSVWLVGWKGTRGEGWSYDRSGVLKDFDDEKPRWTDVTVGGTVNARWMIGTLDDGRCEAVVAESFIGMTAPSNKRTAATCEEALTSLDAELAAAKAAKTKADRDAEAARIAREAAERAETYRRKKMAYDQLVAANAAEEKAREAERPLIEQYEKLATAYDFGPACKVALRLRPMTHIHLFGQRAGTIPHLRLEERACVNDRKDISSQDERVALAAANATLADAQIAAKREAAVQRPVGDWNPGGGSSGPSAADRLRATHDYMYGSGRASTCPFTDRSLCK